MFKASVELADGSALYIFGLSKDNIRLLQEGKPIKFSLAPLGGKGEVAIFAGDTEESMKQEIEQFIGPMTMDMSKPN